MGSCILELSSVSQLDLWHGLADGKESEISGYFIVLLVLELKRVDSLEESF